MGCHIHCTSPVPGKGGAGNLVGGGLQPGQTPPVSWSPFPPTAKPGICPKRKVLHTFAPCKSSCRDDSDCPHHKKCCFTGCGLGCLPPQRGTVVPLLPAGWGHQLGPAASNGTVSSGDICHLPPVPGPCRGRFRHYAYNSATGTCQPFTYSGCGGNPNNFKTVEECQQVCQQQGERRGCTGPGWAGLGQTGLPLPGQR